MRVNLWQLAPYKIGIKDPKSFPTTALGMGPFLVSFSLQSSAIDVNKVKIRRKAAKGWFVGMCPSNCQAQAHDNHLHLPQTT